MTWRDRLQKGSFRNEPFEVESSNASGGRRVVVHEIPGGDDPLTEDLGRRRHEFPLEVLVSGPDYMALRDRLIEALDAPGPGELVHPYLGRKNVIVSTYRLRESTNKGGLARFSISFTETAQAPPAVRTGAGTPSAKRPSALVSTIAPAPGVIAAVAGAKASITPDTAAVVAAAAEDGRAAAQDEFAGLFTVAAAPEFVAAAAEADSLSMLDKIKGFAAKLGRAAQFATDLQNDLNEVLSEVTGVVESIANPLAALVRLPANLATGVMGGINLIRAIANDPLQALGIYKGMFKLSAGGGGGGESTPSRKRQTANRAALEALFQLGAVTAAAEASAEAEYPSAAEALAARDAILAALDAQMETAGDELYPALVALRAALVADIAARGANLPGVVNFTPAAVLPAVVIAHRLYGDATQADSLVVRNAIRHPGFVPAGEPLEVLTGV